MSTDQRQATAATSTRCPSRRSRQQLKQFEIEERKRLGLPVENAKHWFDAVPREFTRDQREHTTILVSGLTMAHDLFIQARAPRHRLQGPRDGHAG